MLSWLNVVSLSLCKEFIHKPFCISHLELYIFRLCKQKKPGYVQKEINQICTHKQLLFVHLQGLNILVNEISTQTWVKATQKCQKANRQGSKTGYSQYSVQTYALCKMFWLPNPVFIQESKNTHKAFHQVMTKSSVNQN